MQRSAISFIAVLPLPIDSPSPESYASTPPAAVRGASGPGY